VPVVCLVCLVCLCVLLQASALARQSNLACLVRLSTHHSCASTLTECLCGHAACNVFPYECNRTPAQVLVIQGFLACRKHHDRLLLMVRMMSRSGFPCFKQGERAVKALEKRFQLHLTEVQCVQVGVWAQRAQTGRDGGARGQGVFAWR